MLLDLYWVTKGGGDLIHLLKNYPDRFELFPVKDMDKTPEKSFTCPGHGIIDFKKIFSEAKKTNIKHYIVEIFILKKITVLIFNAIYVHLVSVLISDLNCKLHTN